MTSFAALRRQLNAAWALGIYALLSLLLFGLPVLGHLDSRIVAADQLDSSALMWFLAWWPHAILHGLNPFVTHVMFVPEGFNITWSTAIPGPAIVLSPITLAFGPAVTWNVIQLAAPALSAWTAFLLCRHLTGRLWPSLAGGYVFGFSPYMLINVSGAPTLALVALLPVLTLLVLRRIEGSIGPRRFVATMTAALTAQYLISGEVLVTATLFGAIALVLSFALFAELRPALLDTCRLLVAAYGLTAVLISPFLYFFLFGHHYPPSATNFRAVAEAFVVPPPLVAITASGPPLGGSGTESYLGVPLIILILLFMWQLRRERSTWLISALLLLAAILSFGRYLTVGVKLTSIPGPWRLLAQLPLLRYTVPVRLAVFVALPAAVIVAMWLSRGPLRGRRGYARAGLAVLAVAFIVPDAGNHAWDTHIKDPAFFSSGAYRRYLKSSDQVLTIPAWGPNQRWQADTGFAFKLAGGYAGNPFPPSYTRYPTWNTLLTGHMTSDSAAQLRQFVRAKGVTAIVVDVAYPGPWRRLFGTLGVRPISVGGVQFYRLHEPK